MKTIVVPFQHPTELVIEGLPSQFLPSSQGRRFFLFRLSSLHFSCKWKKEEGRRKREEGEEEEEEEEEGRKKK